MYHDSIGTGRTPYLSIQLDKKSGQLSCRANVKSEANYGNVSVYQIGTFYDSLGQLYSAKGLYQAYSHHGSKTYDILDGTGMLVIVDRDVQKLFAFTDYFNSILPLFYREMNDRVVLSTDLLSLTKGMNNLSISSHAAQMFMLHGMVFGKHTLIRHINKLPAKYYLEVDLKNGHVHCRRCQYSIPRQAGINRQEYNACFGKCIEECYQKGAAMTLSGGFDTNYLLHHLLKVKANKGDDSRIRAYCGGGISGKDETGISQEMADLYGNIDLTTFLVDHHSLQHYPEIVLMLQGVCFEEGIFLHYHMAKLFAQHQVKYVYTGDLADQVMNLETYQYTKATWKRMILMTLRGMKHYIFGKKYDFFYWMFRGRYETAALKLLKKSGQMWGYFGAEGIYPYVRRPFLSIAKSKAVSGDYSKQYHREVVLNTVDSVIAEKIKRNGGNTDPIALFDEHTKTVLKQQIKDMPWYRVRNYVNENQQLGYELRILYIDLVRRIFVNHECDEADESKYPLLMEMYPAFSDHCYE